MLTRLFRNTSIAVAIPFILLIGLGLSAYLYFYAQGLSTFVRDQTYFALAALRFFDTYLSAYPPGQEYYSSIPIVYHVPVAKLFGSSALLLFRSQMMLGVGTFFVLYALFVKQVWGKWTALLGLGLIVLPLRMIFHRWIDYGALLPIGFFTLFLLLRPTPQTLWKYALHFLLLGIGLGMAFWASSEARVYALLVGYIITIRSPEWAQLLHFFQKYIQKSHAWLAYTLLYSSLVVLGCATIFREWHDYRSIATQILFTGGFFFLVALYATSKDRLRLGVSHIFLLLGYIIGDAPRWLMYIMFDIRPFERIRFHYVDLGDQLFEMATDTFPRVLGLTSQLTPTILYAFLYTGIILLLGIFLWQERTTLRKILTLQPLTTKESGTLILLALTVLPIIGSIFTQDRQVPGYIQATRIGTLSICAIATLRLLQPFRLLFICWLLIFGLTTSIFSLWQQQKAWNTPNTWPTREAIYAAENFFQRYDIDAAYSQSGIACGFSFLLDDRIIFDDQRKRQRFSEDYYYVRQAPRFGLLFRLGDDMRPPRTEEELASFADKNHARISKILRYRLHHATLLDSARLDSRWILLALEDGGFKKPSDWNERY